MRQDHIRPNKDNRSQTGRTEENLKLIWDELSNSCEKYHKQIQNTLTKDPAEPQDKPEGDVLITHKVNLWQTYVVISPHTPCTGHQHTFMQLKPPQEHLTYRPLFQTKEGGLARRSTETHSISVKFKVNLTNKAVKFDPFLPSYFKSHFTPYAAIREEKMTERS